MVVAEVGLIITFAFLLEAAAGAATFALFRWIADQNPPSGIAATGP